MPPITSASVAIDLGSSVITTVVGERHEQGRLQILGVGQAPSAGIEAGQISHVSRAAAAIRQSLDQAEASSGRQILSVGLAVTGAHLESVNNRGAVALPRYGEPIRDADLARAIGSGRAVTINSASTMLHAIPRYYVVDSELRSFDPRGQHGQRLDVSMHLVTASQSAIQNSAHCVQSAGVDVELIAAKPVVAAERAVRGDEKEFGALVIGLDSGTTSLTAFEDGAISHTSVIPIGTSFIARDLSVGLQCSNDEARLVMQMHGSAVPELVPEHAPEIVLRGFSAVAGEERRVPPAFVAKIIYDRVCEIITMVLNRASEQQLQQAIAGGVVLTGGGAALADIDLLVSKAMDAHARVAPVGDLYGLTDKLNRPDSFGAIGMLDWMLDSGDAMQADQRSSQPQEGAGGGSLFGALASSIGSLARVFSPHSPST